MKNFIILKSPKLFIVFVLVLFCSTAYPQITQWTSKGPGAGGALFSPSFSPHNSDEIYIACDMSELFHTTNLGLTWSVISFNNITGNNGANVRFTENPQILYCINFAGDLMTPSKSTDGGVTWSAIASDPTFRRSLPVFELLIRLIQNRLLTLRLYDTVLLIKRWNHIHPKIQQCKWLLHCRRIL